MRSDRFSALLRTVLAGALAACAVSPWTARGTGFEGATDTFFGHVSFALPDGRRLVGGMVKHEVPPRIGYAFAVQRLNPDGTADDTFNGSGLSTAPIWGYYESVVAIAVQADGRIILAGNAADPAGGDPRVCYPAFCRYYPALTRLDADGTLDRSFNHGGRLVVAIGDRNSGPEVEQYGTLTNIALTADGKILVFEGDLATARVNADGTLDTEFVPDVAALRPASQGAREFPIDRVVEYYNASLDHYFLTWRADEMDLLDEGTSIKGWARTGRTFNVFTTMPEDASAACRFYIPPALGNSHFFGRDASECNATAARDPAFVLEDANFFQTRLPTSGSCPPHSAPIYRVFSGRPDASHRYMTDRVLRDEMVAKGWVPEGDGPDHVAMCSPQ